MDLNDNVSTNIMNLCQKIGISQSVLAGIIGKTQKGVSDRFSNDTFSTTEFFKIADALNCNIKIIFDDKYVADNNEQLYEIFLITTKEKGYSGKDAARFMGISYSTYLSRMETNDIKIKLILNTVVSLGCKINIEVDSSKAKSKEELYKAFYKNPLSAEARERKNAHQREYAKRTDFKSNRIYNEKTYKQYTFGLRRKEDADVIEFIESKKAGGGGVADILREAARKKF